MIDTLRTRGIEVAVLGPIVEYDLALPRLLADEMRRGDKSAAWARRTPGIRERDREMNALVTAHGAAYVSVYDAICRSERCDEFVGGKCSDAVRQRSFDRAGFGRGRPAFVGSVCQETGWSRQCHELTWSAAVS